VAERLARAVEEADRVAIGSALGGLARGGEEVLDGLVPGECMPVVSGEGGAMRVEVVRVLPLDGRRHRRMEHPPPRLADLLIGDVAHAIVGEVEVLAGLMQEAPSPSPPSRRRMVSTIRPPRAGRRVQSPITARCHVRAPPPEPLQPLAQNAAHAVGNGVSPERHAHRASWRCAWSRPRADCRR
jgi:hypothetical protein